MQMEYRELSLGKDCLVRRKQILENLTGIRFGRYVVIGNPNKIKNQYYWECICDCGTIKNVRGGHLKSGKIVSCGCHKNEGVGNRSRTHGLSKTRIYRIYKHMLDRCYSSTCQDFSEYGGRGIKICDKWLKSFVNFYEWSILHGYSPILSIDRIDVNGNYSPENCRWATNIQQANNKRNNHYIEFDGKTMTISQWSKATGISQDAIERRINKYHWNFSDALTRPTVMTS